MNKKEQWDRLIMIVQAGLVSRDEAIIALEFVDRGIVPRLPAMQGEPLLSDIIPAIMLMQSGE